MSDPFLAEIRIFSGNYAPIGWARCDGQKMPISQNTALFSLLGTFYGGDGMSTFLLPKLQGCAPMSQGNGAGLSPRGLGDSAGEAAVTLAVEQMPAHDHFVLASNQIGTDRTPAGEDLARSKGMNLYGPSGTIVPMAIQAIGTAGNSSPHNNLQPYLVMTFIIALHGIFPQRS